MKKRLISRRAFLRGAAITSTAVAIGSLTGCGSNAASSSVSESSSVAVGAADGAMSSAVADTSVDADKNGRVDHIAIAIPTDPQELLPWNCKANSKTAIYKAIYDTLFDYIDGEYVPRAAKSYTVIDGLHTQVDMYDYITDWKGNNITAQDVVDCYDRFVAAGYLRRWTYFGSVEATDTYTLKFTWAFETYDIGPYEYIWCGVPIYSSSTWDETAWATDPVGTGPYTLVEFTSGNKVIVKYNDNYWQKEELRNVWSKAFVDECEFDIIPESAQVAINLENGTIDMAYTLPNEYYQQFEKNSDYNCASLLGHDIWTLIPNASTDSPLNDVNMRLACYYAVDSDAVASAMEGTFACHGFGSKSCPDYSDTFEKTSNYFNTCDVALAKDYLKKANYNGQSIRLLTSIAEKTKSAGVVIQLCLQQAGINCELTTLDENILDTTMSETDGWELLLGGFGGTFVANEINKMFNRKEYSGEYALGFIKDDKLQTLTEAVCDSRTHNKDSIDALGQYVLDNAYGYILNCANLDVVVPKYCSVVVSDGADVFPTCCEFKVS